MGRRRRIAVAVLMLPMTVPFFLFWQFMEWFHFKVSGRALSGCRWLAARWQKFVISL
jgi:hypothetical protein